MNHNGKRAFSVTTSLYEADRKKNSSSFGKHAVGYNMKISQTRVLVYVKKLKWYLHCNLDIPYVVTLNPT